MTALVTEFPAAFPDSLSRAQAGDREAFAEIVMEQEAMVYSLAYHFFRDRSRAEEIAQDCFTQLFRNLHRIESESHLVRWLRQVTMRRCIDIARKSRMQLVPLEAAGELAGGERLSDPLLQRTLRGLIAGLPARQRAILTLRYQEDLDPSEISAIVALPVNTVKSLLHRALQSLRRKLGETK